MHQPPWSFGFDSQMRGTRENRAPPCVKVPGSSRVPVPWRSAVMARHRRRRPPGGHTTAAGSGGWRATISTDTDKHTYCLFYYLPPTHPFVGATILQRHFQVRWRARLRPPRVLLPHTYTQDGWFLQPERRPARLPCRTIFSICIHECLEKFGLRPTGPGQ